MIINIMFILFTTKLHNTFKKEKKKDRGERKETEKGNLLITCIWAADHTTKRIGCTPHIQYFNGLICTQKT